MGYEENRRKLRESRNRGIPEDQKNYFNAVKNHFNKTLTLLKGLLEDLLINRLVD